MQNSQLLRVQYPIPQKRLSDILFCFTHTKAIVLYVNPHSFKTENPSSKQGSVTHKNKAQSFSANSCTGKEHISAVSIVG